MAKVVKITHHKLQGPKVESFCLTNVPITPEVAPKNLIYNGIKSAQIYYGNALLWWHDEAPWDQVGYFSTSTFVKSQAVATAVAHQSNILQQTQMLFGVPWLSVVVWNRFGDVWSDWTCSICVWRSFIPFARLSNGQLPLTHAWY